MIIDMESNWCVLVETILDVSLFHKLSIGAVFRIISPLRMQYINIIIWRDRLHISFLELNPKSSLICYYVRKAEKERCFKSNGFVGG